MPTLRKIAKELMRHATSDIPHLCGIASQERRVAGDILRYA
jgi:hypothetical protein